MDVETVRERIVPVKGYDSLKRRLLCGELERYRRSLEWIDPRPDGSLLDLGSRGDLVPAYQHILGYHRIVCLDTAGATGRRRLVHRDGAVYEFDAYRINLESEPFPFPDADFDQVVAMEVLEHLAVDPMFMLAEANRVLRPGGTLLLTTPNITSLASLYLQLWGRHPAIGRQTFGPGITDRHHREYAPREVKEVLIAAGFEMRRFDTFDPLPPNRSFRRTARLLRVLNRVRSGIDLDYRGSVIRCLCVKTGEVIERFPETIYPRYAYYDYAAYDRELAERFGGRRYWRTNLRTAEPARGETPAADHPAGVAAQASGSRTTGPRAEASGTRLP